MNIKFVKLANAFDLNCANVSHFYPLEAVDRGSETQLQVDKNLIL